MKSDKATVIMFICNHCPYVKHINAAMVKLANDYIPKGMSFIAINSNDAAAYPDDSADNMKKQASELKYPFPYLVDATQSVAKAYGAVCTPDFFIYDSRLQLVYRGQIDDSRPSNQVPSDARDIRAALDAMLAGNKPSPRQRPSIGCDIKWKK
jgi:thiol-disulfide isomerase/thioredoxin